MNLRVMLMETKGNALEEVEVTLNSFPVVQVFPPKNGNPICEVAYLAGGRVYILRPDLHFHIYAEEDELEAAYRAWAKTLANDVRQYGMKLADDVPACLRPHLDALLTL